MDLVFYTIKLVDKAVMLFKIRVLLEYIVDFCSIIIFKGIQKDLENILFINIIIKMGD